MSSIDQMRFAIRASIAGVHAQRADRRGRFVRFAMASVSHRWYINNRIARTARLKLDHDQREKRSRIRVRASPL